MLLIRISSSDKLPKVCVFVLIIIINVIYVYVRKCFSWIFHTALIVRVESTEAKFRALRSSYTFSICIKTTRCLLKPRVFE